MALWFNLGGLLTITPTWQRFSVAWISNVSESSTEFGVIGNVGTSKYADISVWGFQIEPGSTATSYIPTNGAAARQSDLKSLAGFVSQTLGSYDTFLYQDPDFNTVQLQKFANGDGTTAAFNLTAAFAPGSEVEGYLLPACVLSYAVS